MAGESKLGERAASTRAADIFVRKKVPGLERRISFRELAKLASPRKTEQFLASKTGSDPRSARRWLRGERAPAAAVYAVLADIFSRID